MLGIHWCNRPDQILTYERQMLIWLFGVKTKSVFLSFFPIFCFQAEVDMHFIAVENFTSAPLVRKMGSEHLWSRILVPINNFTKIYVPKLLFSHKMEKYRKINQGNRDEVRPSGSFATLLHWFIKIGFTLPWTNHMT